MAAARSRVFQMIEMRGGTLPTAAALGGEDSTWFYSDTAFTSFSQEVPLHLVNDPERFVVRAAVSLVCHDGDDWTTAERVRNKDVPAWLNEKRAGAGRDPRVLQVSHSDTVQRLTFPAAVEAMQPAVIGPLATGRIFPVA